MKLLYIYDKMPSVYQEYMNVLLHEIKKRTPLSVLAYSDENEADYNMKSNRLKSKFQNFIFKIIGKSKPTVDIDIIPIIY